MNMLILKLYFLLFKEFFLIGVFSFGGGYAALPFLYNLISKYGWYSSSELSNAVALSALTPGPIGINIATYAGLKTGGILCSAVATFSIVIPAFFVVIFTYKFINKFKESVLIKGILFSLRPTSCALLSYVCLNMIYGNLVVESSFRIFALIIFSILFIFSLFRNFNPLQCMIFAVLIGYLVKIGYLFII